MSLATEPDRLRKKASREPARDLDRRRIGFHAKRTLNPHERVEFETLKRAVEQAKTREERAPLFARLKTLP